MNQFIYLSTCDTCKSILKEVNLPKDITLRDIKKNPLKPNELKSFKNITGTFRSLLNNRAQKLKSIDKSILSEEKIFYGNNEISFKIDPFKKKCLLEGLDDIALSLEKTDKILSFEKNLKNSKPWIFND